jgi:hypothetical protein
MMASSAKRQVLDIKHSRKSLMNIKNKNGSKTVPCGTPLSTEVAPSTMTCCDLSERNALGKEADSRQAIIDPFP